VNNETSETGVIQVHPVSRPDEKVEAPNPVHLTERAAAQITRSLLRRGSGKGIRLGVKTTGCSGLAYLLEYVDLPDPTDIEVEQHGVRVFVSRSSLPYLAGTSLDFVREGLNEGFSFDNPNVRSTCGCGESFRT
jgi:iron-sulfur cluster assembly protein